jgi:hypothetical protein
MCIKKIRQHDPQGIVQSHLKSVGLVTTTQHQIYPEEELLMGALTFEETLLKIRDPIEK